MAYYNTENQEKTNQEKTNQEKTNPWKTSKVLSMAAIFFVLGLFFKAVLIGYQTIALIFFGLTALALLLHYIPVKGVRCALLGMTAAGVLCLALIEIPIVSASDGDYPNDSDYMIVLGAGVNGDVPSLSLHNRLVAAKAWLEEHPDSIAVLSGGQGPGENITEAEAMYRWLVNNGIDASRLYKEEQSASTRENFQYSAVMLQELNGGTLPQQVAVVSSEYHLYRAKQFAQQAGITMLGIPAETTYPVLKLNYFLREGAAVARLWALGY